MRIAIDGRTITSSRSGVGVYADRIVRSLLHIDSTNEYTLFLVEPQDDLEAPNLTKILIEGYDRMLLNRWWENVLLPEYVLKHGIDVYFSPAYALPVLPRLRPFAAWVPLPRRLKRMFGVQARPRYVVSIHDVITSVLPETFTPKMRMWQYIFNSNAVRVADLILASSESTRKDILRHFGGDPDKMTVVLLSVDDHFRRITDTRTLEAVRERYGLPQEFVLNIGTIEPRKNLVTLCRAYAGLSPELRARFPLVISGARGWYSDDILRAIHDLQLGDSVQFIGYASHDDLPSLYSLATLFVFPSLYEGFGYPPLEAMACGTPVVSSSSSSLPEVVGDAAPLVDPKDVSGLTEAMRSVLIDPEYQDSLRTKGYARAGALHWKGQAEKTLDAFRAVYSGSS